MVRVIFIAGVSTLFSTLIWTSATAQPQLPVAEHSIVDTDYQPEQQVEIDPGQHPWHVHVKVKNEEASLSLRVTLKAWLQQKDGTEWEDIAGPFIDIETIAAKDSEWLQVGNTAIWLEGEYRWRWEVHCTEIIEEPDTYGGPGTTIGPELNPFYVEED